MIKYCASFFKRKLAILLLFALALTSLLSLISNLNSSRNQTLKYNISFGDSGVGGLIFALDAYKEIDQYLYDIESKYYVKFNFYHVGDSINAPYGTKNRDDIKFLTNNFIHHMVQNYNPNIAIAACNTASTIFDKNYQKYINNTFSKTTIWPIIYDSASKLYDNTKIVKNSLGKKEMHIGILATKAVVNSGVYEKALNQIHNQKHQRDNVAMYIYSFSPKYWVENIENGVENKIQQQAVKNDLDEMVSIFPDVKTISSLGLFCTHFPFLENNIESFFAENFNNNPNIITQGALFGRKIKHQIELEISKNKIKKRKTILEKDDLHQILIYSDITGNNIDKMKLVTRNMFPEISNKILFRKIDKIKYQPQ